MRMSKRTIMIAVWLRFNTGLATVALTLPGALLPISIANAADENSDSTPDNQPRKSDESRGSSQPASDDLNASSASKAVPGVPVGPAPKPPRPEDQELRPYVAPVEPKVKDRHLTLSLVAGTWLHSLNGKGASTSIGPVWGVSGRVDPYRWMGIRVSILRGNQPESPEFGGLGVPNTQISQSDFQIIYWSIRMEPTWHVSETLSLWAGVGLGWARAIAPEPTVGSLNWISADRACVYVEGQWAIGAEYELVQDWLMLGVDLSAGMLGWQHGSAHDPIQAFTPEGHMTHVGGYPDFSRKYQALFGLGVIL